MIDLVRMKAYTYTPDGDGKGKESDIPANMADAAQKAHEALIEMVAEGNDELMEEFFDKGTLPVEHILDRPQAGRSRDAHFPGAVRLRPAQYRRRPDPEFHRRQPAGAHRAGGPRGQPSTATKPIAEDRRTPSALSAFVFKTTADPFAGRITYFKVITGVVKNDANLHERRTAAPRAPGAHRQSAWARRCSR